MSEPHALQINGKVYIYITPKNTSKEIVLEYDDEDKVPKKYRRLLR